MAIFEDSVCVFVVGRCGCWLSRLERRGGVVSELLEGLGGNGNINVGRAVMGAVTSVREEGELTPDHGRAQCCLA
jgi:hypothetical protein